jgi:hypothetical protein
MEPILLPYENRAGLDTNLRSVGILLEERTIFGIYVIFALAA